jgi:BlaI family transcriptional regulator, penicillinase repressor
MKLSELELRILKHIWEIGASATVQEVLEAWTEEPKPQYTTILKTLQILEEKKLVGHEKQGRAYRYIPLISKKEAMHSNLGGIVKNFFGGDKLAFAQTFITDNKFSATELAELKKMLAEKESEANNAQL